MKRFYSIIIATLILVHAARLDPYGSVGEFAAAVAIWLVTRALYDSLFKPEEEKTDASV